MTITAMVKRKGESVLVGSDKNYPRAPITEAVIEIRFGDAVDAKDLLKASDRFKSRYSAFQPVEQNQFELRAAENGALASAEVGTPVVIYRHSSSHEREIAVLMPHRLLVSELAPYAGWANFINRFERDWSTWVKTVGRRKIDRIGMRYINRIDIPIETIIEEEEYVNVSVRAPKEFGAAFGYAMTVVFPLQNIDGAFVINTSIPQPPPVPGFASIVIDIDLGKFNQVPQRDDEILSLLNDMRLAKNRIFETCITDKARELFL